MVNPWANICFMRCTDFNFYVWICCYDQTFFLFSKMVVGKSVSCSVGVIIPCLFHFVHFFFLVNSLWNCCRSMKMVPRFSVSLLFPLVFRTSPWLFFLLLFIFSSVRVFDSSFWYGVCLTDTSACHGDDGWDLWISLMGFVFMAPALDSPRQWCKRVSGSGLQSSLPFLLGERRGLPDCPDRIVMRA